MENKQENQEPAEEQNPKTIEEENIPKEGKEKKEASRACLVGSIFLFCCSLVLFGLSIWFTGHFILGWW